MSTMRSILPSLPFALSLVRQRSGEHGEMRDSALSVPTMRSMFALFALTARKTIPALEIYHRKARDWRQKDGNFPPSFPERSPHSLQSAISLIFLCFSTTLSCSTVSHRRDFTRERKYERAYHRRGSVESEECGRLQRPTREHADRGGPIRTQSSGIIADSPMEFQYRLSLLHTISPSV